MVLRKSVARKLLVQHLRRVDGARVAKNVVVRVLLAKIHRVCSAGGGRIANLPNVAVVAAERGPTGEAARSAMADFIRGRGPAFKAKVG